jgi:hypothetical protein
MTYRSRHPDRVREADKAYTIKYYQGNRKVIQERIRLRKYGLTADELNQMRVDQDFSCAICHIAIAADRGTAARNAEHVDHDHRTGKVRALLCSPCNRTLGVVDDDIRMLAVTSRGLRCPLRHGSASSGPTSGIVLTVGDCALLPPQIPPKTSARGDVASAILTIGSQVGAIVAVMIPIGLGHRAVGAPVPDGSSSL